MNIRKINQLNKMISIAEDKGDWEGFKRLSQERSKLIAEGNDKAKVNGRYQMHSPSKEAQHSDYREWQAKAVFGRNA